MMGGDGWDSSDLDLAASDGGFFSNHYSAEDTRTIVVDFVSRYEAKYGAKPDALAALAYDATNLLLAAIEKAGKDDPAAVKDAMAALEYEAVSGKITFDAQHNPIKAAVVMQVKDGKVVFADSIAP
jgi:branched-chain amino acid transport system substrate-binding protein